MKDFLSGYLVNSDVWLMKTRRISLILSLSPMIDQEASRLSLLLGTPNLSSILFHIFVSQGQIDGRRRHGVDGGR